MLHGNIISKMGVSAKALEREVMPMEIKDVLTLLFQFGTFVLALITTMVVIVTLIIKK